MDSLTADPGNKCGDHDREIKHLMAFTGFPDGSVLKNLPANAEDIRDTGSIAGLGSSLGGGHDNQLQYSCLGNPMDRGTWRAAVHGIARDTGLIPGLGRSPGGGNGNPLQ